MSKPMLSVLMPIYNAEKFLEDALDSVISQVFEDFELILINDGSTDGSLDILNKYAKQDKRCLVHTRENQGIVSSLNYGLEVARADLIARMDSDDICMQDRFHKQIEYLRSNPDCVALGSKVQTIDPDGMPISDDWFSQLTHQEIDSANMSGAFGSVMCHPSVMFRKKAVLGVGGYRQLYVHAEDYDLFLRLAEVGKLASYPEVLLRYRVHPKSIGHAKRQDQMYATYRVLQDAYKRRGITMTQQLAFEMMEKQQSVGSTESELYQSWGWLALNNHHLATARKYAKKLIFSKPLSFESWKFALCVLRGY